MIIFPQLSNAALCQFPIHKVRQFRTITNRLEDGSRLVLEDANARSIRWKLAYAGISDQERASLESFFESTEGRLQSFTFADPTGNLLAWSEDLTQAAWQKNTFLQTQSSVTDPLGTQRAIALVNGSGGSLNLVQTISIPGSYLCCWSFYARSDSGAIITLTRGSLSRSATVSSSWQRVFLSGVNPDGGDTSDFGLTLPSGAQIDCFGLQVEAQSAPSTYVETLGNGGVYPFTRFDSDVLTFTANAPNSSSCELSLYTRVNS